MRHPSGDALHHYRESHAVRGVHGLVFGHGQPSVDDRQPGARQDGVAFVLGYDGAGARFATCEDQSNVETGTISRGAVKAAA